MAAEDRAARVAAISLFIDDTNMWPLGGVAALLDFCEAQGVRGKISLIPGLDVKPGQRHMGQKLAPDAVAFMSEMALAGARGFDVHMELMTHKGLWDFAADRVREDGQHEGVWLHEPEVPVAAYEAYFEGVLAAARAGGVAINGVTVPGCDCSACSSRLAQLRAEDHEGPSENAWQALLDLAERGGFGVPVVAVFHADADEARPMRIMASRDGFGVYDARMDVIDLDLLRQGALTRADVDLFITEDGQSGHIADLVRAGAETCFFDMHWMKMNPANDEGWAAFREVIRRINATLGDRVAWVKPSDYGRRLLDG